MIFFILIIGIVVLLLTKYVFKDEISWKEFGLSAAIFSIIVMTGYGISMVANTQDVEIISGKVVSKTHDRVSCRHSYPCNCRQQCSGYGKNESCYTVCDTCYVHDYDIDWNVHSTIGTIGINTVDSQGLREPPRWTEVKINEPVSSRHGFTNYIKAVPNSLFNTNSDFIPPPYPAQIYDYYKINRVVLDTGVQISQQNYNKLNEKISDSLKDLASQKQVNIVVVLTKNTNEIYAENLKASWLGGKKNDIVVVISFSDYPTIQWVTVFGWSKSDLINVSIRNDIMDYGKIDEHIIDITTNNIEKYWNRKPMSEFEYLKNEIKPSNTAYIIIFVFGILVIGGLVWYFYNNDI